MALVDTDGWFNTFCDHLLGEVRWEMRVSVWHEASRHAQVYLDGTSVVREGDDIVVTVRGMIPNFIEHGLGPGGLGTEGAFDMRANLLKGREHRAIPMPVGIRTISVKGKPWIHPGFKRMAFLPKIQAKMARLVDEASHRVGMFHPVDEWSSTSPQEAPRTHTTIASTPTVITSTKGT
jgi:hypothetical protein